MNRNSGLAYTKKKEVQNDLDKLYDIIQDLFVWIEKREDFVVLRVSEKVIRKLFDKMGRELPEALMTSNELGKKQAQEVIEELQEEEPKRINKVVGVNIYH